MNHKYKGVLITNSILLVLVTKLAQNILCSINLVIRCIIRI